MSRRYFRNGQATSLAFPVGALDTTIQVNSATSFPTQYPYTLILEPDGVLEEVIDVTNGTGNILTVTRGVDGSTASAHSSGVQVYHGVSARDPDEANAHVNSNTNVHGISGSIVDTASSQAITGTKNFTALQVGGSPVVATGGTQTVDGNKTFTGTNAHTGAETFTGTAAFSNAAMRPVAVSEATLFNGVAVSATYASGAPVCGTTFTAPPSGQVYVTVGGRIQNDTATNTTYLSFEVRAGGSFGTGTVMFAADNASSIAAGIAASARAGGSKRILVTGLTAGATYNVRTMYAGQSAGTATLFNRDLIVEPVF